MLERKERKEQKKTNVYQLHNKVLFGFHPSLSAVPNGTSNNFTPPLRCIAFNSLFISCYFMHCIS